MVTTGSLDIDQISALETLDQQLRAVKNGKVQCNLGFIATFYVRTADQPNLRELAVEALELYQSGVGDKLLWGADPKTGVPKKLAGGKIADVRSWMAKIGPQDDFEYTFHGGKNKDDADPYFANCFVKPDATRLSFVRFGWPLSWVTQYSLAAFAKLVDEFSAIIKPSHGYAGWAVVTHVMQSDSRHSMAPVTAFARRFRGLEVEQVTSHAIDLERREAIKGINWLTILGNPWLEKLGGLGALKVALGEGIPVRPYGEGVVIQAGPRPLLGDVNAGEKMDAYYRVSLALKPIRTDYLDAFATGYGFGQEQTTEWLKRFDVP
ncbi:MAG: type VI immunity family protein [Polyangiaceae bacterium]